MEKVFEVNTFRDHVLRILHLSGFSPLDYGYSCTLKRFWSISSHLLVTVGILLELLLNYQGFGTVIRASKILPVQVTLVAKMLLPALKKNALKDILERMNFSLSHIYDEEINEVGQKNNQLVHKIFKIQVINTVILILAMFLTAVFTRYPFALTYNETNMSNTYWNFVLFVESNYLISQSLTVCGIDGLFGFMVSHIIREIKMLKMAITKSTFGSTSIGWRVLIEYHVHILRLVKDVIDAFSFMLFTEYLMNMGTVCFNLVLLTSDGFPPDMKHIAEYGVVVLYLLFILTFFSYAGDVLTDQCEQLSDIVFHEMTEDLVYEKNGIISIMMIQRSQKSSSFTLGGFFALNLMTLNSVSGNDIYVD
ncbi:hypothetical protein WA026_007920 [Henosepilachna vigintioctopunctata]|uniref:Odorant receptor n=1 Tax=Henosepilachna vigintioctopunctata TaxID=420089 RepID=A0AAW1TVE1_9CUCU